MQCSNCHSVIEPNVNPTSICISKKSVDCRDMCKICKVYSETCVYCRIQALHKVRPITNHRLDGQELRQSKNEVVKHIRDSEYDIYIPSIQNNPNGYQILNDSLEDKLTEILRKRDSLPKKKQMDAILGDQSVEDYMFSSQLKYKKARWEILIIHIALIPTGYFLGFILNSVVFTLVFLPVMILIEFFSGKTIPNMALEDFSPLGIETFLILLLGLFFAITQFWGLRFMLQYHKESVNQVKNSVGYVINKYPETWEEFNWPRYEYLHTELKYLRKALRILKDISLMETKIKKIETECAKIPHKIHDELGYEWSLKQHLEVYIYSGSTSLSRPVAGSRPDPRLLCSVCGIGTGSSCDCWDDP